MDFFDPQNKRSVLKVYLSILLDNICYFKENHPDGEYSLMYRGHANPSFQIWPSVFRDNNLQKEAQMVEELKRIAPQEFSACSSQLDYLIKMQHYGLPTRLLDVTFNPLVALFFACYDRQSQGQYGMVYTFAAHVHSCDDPLITNNVMLSTYSGSTSADLAKHFHVNSNFLNPDGKSDREALRHLFGKEYYAIAPPLNHERIRRQQGGFLLFGLNFEKQKNPFQKEAFKLYNFSEVINDNVIFQLGIRPDHKDAILDELDSIGINPSFLFPELEHQAAYVKQKYCYSSTNNKKRLI